MECETRVQMWWYCNESILSCVLLHCFFFFFCSSLLRIWKVVILQWITRAQRSALLVGVWCHPRFLYLYQEQLRGLPRVQYLPEPLPRWFSHQEKTGQWRMGKNSSKVGNDLKTSKCQSMMGAKSKWFVLEQRGWTACLFNLCALCSSITTSSSLQCACREGSSYDESIYVMRVLQCVDERNVRLLNIYY